MRPMLSPLSVVLLPPKKYFFFCCTLFFFHGSLYFGAKVWPICSAPVIAPTSSGFVDEFWVPKLIDYGPVDTDWNRRQRRRDTTGKKKDLAATPRFSAAPPLARIFSLFFSFRVCLVCVCGGKGRRSAGGRLTRRLSPKGSTNRGKEGTERAPPLHVEREKNRATTD